MYVSGSDYSGTISPSPYSTFSGASASSLGNIVSNQTLLLNKVTSNKRAEVAQYISNKCPECLAQFSAKEEVAEHFQEVKATQTTVSFLSGRGEKNKKVVSKQLES